MQKTVAIVQSNYVPWKGYFDLINSVDEFILLDDVQYTRRDWRNRNRIKTPQGVRWLTIPVEVKGKYQQNICDVHISDARWREDHWQTLRHCYVRAPYFAMYKDQLEALYRNCGEKLLSRINYRFLVTLCEMLGITPCLTWSSQYEAPPGKTDRIVSLCQKAKATAYLSGPAAKSYLDEAQLAAAGITIQWMDYSGYPEYHQLFPPFVHEVSILDLLLNEGPEASRYMKSFHQSVPVARQSSGEGTSRAGKRSVI
jgi:hypothetical protein